MMISWPVGSRSNAVTVRPIILWRRLARMTELQVVDLMPKGPSPKQRRPRGGARGSQPKRHRPKNINKIHSIAARCKDCGTLIVMRLKWKPGPLIQFAEEIIKSVKTCHACGRKLEKPDLLKLRVSLDTKD